MILYILKNIFLLLPVLKMVTIGLLKIEIVTTKYEKLRNVKNQKLRKIKHYSTL